MSREFDGQLLLDIYTAATQPASWFSVVDRLAGTVDAAGCILFLTDANDQSPWTISAGSELWRSREPHVIEYYERHLAHHEAAAFAALRELPEQTFAASTDADPRFYRAPDRPDSLYLLKHAGVQVRTAARLNDNAAWHDSVAFQFGPAHVTAPHNQLDRARPYLPHLAKTLEFGRLYGRLFRQHAAVLAVLDHVRVGMVIASGTGEPIVSNTAAQALFDERDGLRIDGAGRIAVRDEDLQRQVRAACAALSTTASGAPGRSTEQFAVARAGLRLPLLLEITPLRDGLQELDGGLSASMIMIIDPESDEHVDSSGLARVCGLSAAEADVCTYLVQGLGTPTIAERRSTSVDTVKTQIAQIYRKARVGGRTELVRLAVRMQPPVGPLHRNA